MSKTANKQNELMTRLHDTIREIVREELVSITATVRETVHQEILSMFGAGTTEGSQATTGTNGDKTASSPGLAVPRKRGDRPLSMSKMAIYQRERREKKLREEAATLQIANSVAESSGEQVGQTVASAIEHVMAGHDSNDEEDGPDEDDGSTVVRGAGTSTTISEDISSALSI